MPFSFKVEKPKDLLKTLENVKTDIEKNKGKFEGNEKEGRISIPRPRVEGTYVVTDDALEIIITKHPPFSEKLIKNKIINAINK